MSSNGSWGFRALRPLQEPAVRAVLKERDSLVVLPTGGGKSLCYQLPPMISGTLSLVISPLIALMQDQIDGLTLNGYPAAALHTNCTDDEVEETHRRLDEGELRLLLVSPERAVNGGFLSRLPKLDIGAIAIDEAHCISHWGHDFRPEYRRLVELRQRLPGVSLHAYTATATPRVREDIVRQLELREPEILIGTFDRPNLTYRVLPRVKAADQIAEILKRHENEAGIVYCMSRRGRSSIAEALMKRGVNAAAYHAGIAFKLRKTHPGTLHDRASRRRGRDGRIRHGHRSLGRALRDPRVAPQERGGVPAGNGPGRARWAGSRVRSALFLGRCEALGAAHREFGR